MARTLDRKLQVRLISPWSTRIETSDALFSRDIPAEQADALLCEWAPHAELFTFPRRKAWYCCEPECQFRVIENGRWPALRGELGPGEFLFHRHEDPNFRVPHITHFQPLVMNRGQERIERAIAIVSNFGGSPWRRPAEIAFRNRLITHPLVDLFGRNSWTKFRKHWWNRPAAPANYCGELPGDWPADGKRQLVAKYKVAVCLENMNEPWYFTEKFVEAAVAGCIPVYRADTTLRETVLKGAVWMDPGFGNRADGKIVRTALAASLPEVQAVNARWLSENEFLKQSSAASVFERIGMILATT